MGPTSPSSEKKDHVRMSTPVVNNVQNPKRVRKKRREQKKNGSKAGLKAAAKSLLKVLDTVTEHPNILRFLEFWL